MTNNFQTAPRIDRFYALAIAAVAISLGLIACNGGTRVQNGGETDAGGGDGGRGDGRGVRVRAGSLGGGGNLDGTGAEARFYTPAGVAVDHAGNILVADSGNAVIRKVTPTGVVTVFAGEPGVFGSDDGPKGHFSSPWGLAMDPGGNLFVTDAQSIRKITSAGVISTVVKAGTGMRKPTGIALDATGNLFVTDADKHVIYKVTPQGVLSTFAGKADTSGSNDGTGSAARFDGPSGVAVDGAGTIFVADTRNSAIRKITPGGVVSTFAGPSFDGLEDPYALAFDLSGKLLVADRYKLLSVAPTGDPTLVTRLDGNGIAVAKSGKIYLTGAYALFEVVITGSGFGSGSAALVAGSQVEEDLSNMFRGPRALARDSTGAVFVAVDGAGIRKVTQAGAVSTLVDDFVSNSFSDIGAMAVNSADALIVTASVDTFQRALGKIELNGAFTPIATEPLSANYGDEILKGMNVDVFGNIFLSHDFAGIEKIFKIASDGTVSMYTMFQCHDYRTLCLDGNGIAVDADGNVFIADRDSIRKITADGTVMTVAGQPGKAGFNDGVGTAARFVDARQLTMGPHGELFVADGALVRRVTPDGTVTTVVGIPGKKGVRPGPLPTSLNEVTGIVATPEGNLVILSESAVLDVVF